MSASGVNRPAVSDTYKPNRYNPEHYYKAFVFQKNWIRRAFSYSPESMVIMGSAFVCTVILGISQWYKYSHDDEFYPYMSKYSVVREKDAIPRKLEKGLYS